MPRPRHSTHRTRGRRGHPPRRRGAALLLSTLAVAGLLGAVPPAGAATAGPAGDRAPRAPIRYAPYIDITMARPTLPEVAGATGVKHFTLAFVLGSSAGCVPAWGGVTDLREPRIIDQIQRLRAMGGDVIVASGGAAGPYLEHACGTADALTGAYEQVLDATGATHLDVDIEAAIDAGKVNTALKRLQDRRGTTISYTLRVQGQDYGVDPFSYQILQDAAAKDLDVLVNPMLMNFGFTGPWGAAMVSAAQATLRQMREIWPAKSDAELRAMLGVTPMIGKNDSGMTTTQDDARTLLDFARSNAIGFVGFWSASRDNGGCPDGRVSPTCSGISQGPYEFTGIFRQFATEERAGEVPSRPGAAGRPTRE